MKFYIYCDDCKTKVEFEPSANEHIRYSGDMTILHNEMYGMRDIDLDCKCSKKIKDEKKIKYKSVYTVYTGKDNDKSKELIDDTTLFNQV